MTSGITSGTVPYSHLMNKIQDNAVYGFKTMVDLKIPFSDMRINDFCTFRSSVFHKQILLKFFISSKVSKVSFYALDYSVFHIIRV